MNLTSWALLVIGTFLVFWGFLKPEHQITPREAADLLESRKGYLPKLKENVMNKTKRLEYIRDLARMITFTQYLEMYYSFLKGTRKRPSFLGKLGEIPWAFKIARPGSTQNLYYHDLKNKDDFLNSLETEYELLLSETKDRKLKKRLRNYWDIEDMDNSRLAFEQMVKNDKYHMSPEARQMANKMNTFFKWNLKPKPIREVMERIDELLDGAPDE